MTNRYIILNESQSAHCCFTHSVIDTKEGVEDYSNKETIYWKKCIAETFSLEDAKLIVNALNNLEQ